VGLRTPRCLASLLQNVFPAATTSMRHVVYACYQPASLATPADLERKRAGYREYMLTTHWPSMNIKTYEAKNAIGEGFFSRRDLELGSYSEPKQYPHIVGQSCGHHLCSSLLLLLHQFRAGPYWTTSHDRIGVPISQLILSRYSLSDGDLSQETVCGWCSVS